VTNDPSTPDDVGSLVGGLGEAHHAIVVLDDERRVVDGNERACALLGVSREELLALRVDDVTSDRFRGPLPEVWARLMRLGTQQGTWELVTRGGVIPQEFVAVANVLPGLHVVLMPASDEPAAGADVLSRREREVLALVASGHRTRDIAERMHLSPATVETHLRRAMERLGARSRAHAVALALARDEIDVEEDR
jgi:DNA-binding CsgD family transcriptional regulator